MLGQSSGIIFGTVAHEVAEIFHIRTFGLVHAWRVGAWDECFGVLTGVCWETGGVVQERRTEVVAHVFEVRTDTTVLAGSD